MPGFFGSTITAGLSARAKFAKAQQDALAAAKKLQFEALKDARKAALAQDKFAASQIKAFEDRFAKVREDIKTLTPEKRAAVYEDLVRLHGDFPDRDLGEFAPDAFAKRYGLKVRGAPKLQGVLTPNPAALNLPKYPGLTVDNIKKNLDDPILEKRVTNFDQTLKKWSPYAEKYGKEFDVSPVELLAMIQAESAGNANVGTNNKGATGLLQLTPIALKQIGMEGADISDGETAVRAAAKYYRYLLDQFDDDKQKAIAAYNAGETAVRNNWDAVKNYPETKAHLKLFNAIVGAGSRKQDLAATASALLAYPDYILGSRYQDLGYGSRQLYEKAMFGRNPYGVALDMLDSMAGVSPGISDRDQIFRNPDLYAIARRGVAEVLSRRADAIGGEKVVDTILARLDKTADMVQKGENKAKVEQEHRWNQIDDIVDTFFMGAPRRQMDPSLQARMTAQMSETGVLGSINRVRSWMRRKADQYPNITIDELTFMAEDKFANDIPGFVVAGETSLASRAPGAGPHIPAMATGAYREMFKKYPADIYGTHMTPDGGLMLEMPSGAIAAFSSQDDAARFLKNRSIILGGSVSGEGPLSPATLPASDKVDISVKPLPAPFRGYSATVSAGGKKKTRRFTNQKAATLWAQQEAAAVAAKKAGGQ